MAQHNNPSIANDAVRILNSKGGESVSNELAPLTPVIPILRYANIARSAVNLNSASATIYTTPSDKDFYLTAAAIARTSSNAATGVQSTITATIEGVSRVLLDLPRLTSQQEQPASSLSQTWAYCPIKIDRNTIIAVTNNDGTGTIRTHATIQGYTVEVISVPS
jgi:hypothetical protein